METGLFMKISASSAAIFFFPPNIRPYILFKYFFFIPFTRCKRIYSFNITADM